MKTKDELIHDTEYTGPVLLDIDELKREFSHFWSASVPIGGDLGKLTWDLLHKDLECLYTSLPTSLYFYNKKTKSLVLFKEEFDECKNTDIEILPCVIHTYKVGSDHTTTINEIVNYIVSLNPDKQPVVLQNVVRDVEKEYTFVRCNIFNYEEAKEASREVVPLDEDNMDDPRVVQLKENKNNNVTLGPPKIEPYISQEVSKMLHEAVHHPNHYGGKDNPYEAIKIIEHFNLGVCLGNAIKYIVRAGKKDPKKTLEDLEKVKWYLNREINNLKKNHNI